MVSVPDARLETLPIRLIMPVLSMRDPNISPAAGAVWGTANLGVFIPFAVDQQIIVTQIHLEVTTTGGNVDVGIYDEAGNRLVSNGAVATAAAGVQTFNITDTTLVPGRYYVGISCSATTPAFKECSPLWAASAVGATLVGARQAAAVHPLPATVTYATPTRLTMPLFSLETIV